MQDIYQKPPPSIIILPYDSLDFFFCLRQVLNDRPAGKLRQLVWRLFLDPAMQSARCYLFDKHKIDAVRYGRGSLKERSESNGRNYDAKRKPKYITEELR